MTTTYRQYRLHHRSLSAMLFALLQRMLSDDANARIHVVAESLEQAGDLDHYLWVARGVAFLPHACVVGGSQSSAIARETPIWISMQFDDAPNFDDVPNDARTLVLAGMGVSLLLPEQKSSWGDIIRCVSLADGGHAAGDAGEEVRVALSCFQTVRVWQEDGSGKMVEQPAGADENSLSLSSS